MVLWNVRSKRSLASIWESGGRALEEEEKEKDGWGMGGRGSRNKARQRPAEQPSAGGLALVSSLLPPVIASRLVGFCQCLVFPPNNPSLDQLLKGQLAKQELLC